MREALSTTVDDPSQVALLDGGGSLRLEQQLGQGGFGTVHACTWSDRLAVAKILRTEPTHPRYEASVARMKTEQMCLEKLEIPGIPRLLATGAVKAQPCLVIERIMGSTWKDILHCIPKRRFPERTFPILARDTVRIVTDMHRAGVVHGDIKPDNLMFGSSESGNGLRTWLIDFGLARRLGSASTRMTCEGDTLGTHGYMDPAIVGNAHLRDTRSDIFSLGTTLIEAWGGKDRLNNRAIGDILRSMIATDPAKRPSADEVLDRMAHFASGRLALTIDASDAQGIASALCAWERQRERRTARAMYAICAAALLGIGALLLPSQPQHQSQPSPVSPSKEPLLANVLQKASSSPALSDGSRTAFACTLTTEDLCALLEEAKPGSSAGLPKRTSYTAVLYVAKDTSLLHVTRGCFLIRGTTHRFAAMAELPADAEIRSFLEDWKKLHRPNADAHDLQRANDRLRELKKAANVQPASPPRSSARPG
jgi:serine/threonine protein kinase